MKTTLLCHIYNEEYLLPFWLNHHMPLFDDIIIVDYRSNDKSIEICKKLCPTCKIITTKNDCFSAADVDIEIMELEQNIEGIKMALNVTEFLFCEKPIKQYFENLNEPMSYAIEAISPHSLNEYNPIDYNELISNLLNADMRYNTESRAGFRFIHNFPHGNYSIGRHSTGNTYIKISNMYLLWMGYYPLNYNLLKRKLQIQYNIPLHDKIQKKGFHHFTTMEELLKLNIKKTNNGVSLFSINPKLYNIIFTKYKDLKHVIYPELLNDPELNYGENKIIIENDVNLLKNTDFDNTGFKVINIENYNNLLQEFLKNEIKNVIHKDINLMNYHNEVNDNEHQMILNSMPYKKDSVAREFCIYIETMISDILNIPVKIFNNDIWFRICRPSSTYNDFNPCHRDIYLDFYRNIVNIYLPLVGSNVNSSLKISPGSHKLNENDIIVTKGGAFFNSTKKKFSVDAIVGSKIPIHMERPEVDENSMMLFSPYLFHGCSDNNNEDITRISLEIRFITNDENSVKQEVQFNEFLKNRNWR